MRLQDIERAVALKTELDTLQETHAEIERNSRYRTWQFLLDVRSTKDKGETGLLTLSRHALPVPEAFARAWILQRIDEVKRALGLIGVEA